MQGLKDVEVPFGVADKVCCEGGSAPHVSDNQPQLPIIFEEIMVYKASINKYINYKQSRVSMGILCKNNWQCILIN